MAPFDDKENQPLRFGTSGPDKSTNTGGLKRRAEALEWAPRKKATTGDPLQHHGRHFGRAVYAFANVPALVSNGLASNEDNPPETAQDRREGRIYLKLLKMVPDLEERLAKSPPEEVLRMCNLIQKGASSGRADDTKSMKGPIVDWISPRDGEPLRPTIHRNSKLDRGFNHPRTGALLCPTSLDWSDPAVQQQLRNKEIITLGEDWPLFLYQDEKFDPEEPWRGLLRNRILVLAFKHVFTSPSSTDDNPRATRSGNAKLHGMTRVTPASIAYIATQVRFALSDKGTFCRSDKETDSETFYQTLLELMEDPKEEEEVKKLLAWWNRTIFPAASNGVRIAPKNSALSMIKAKRAKLEAAQAAAAAAELGGPPA
ncbi:hypothetical protein D9611_007065 [Ephemerocybe angulata]|uniref:Uncharacterized protein n=1 Tax=Ephemerocybe angulata TaxID=980116 RepID=A0A8H5B0Z2_9AGAR|nr:hypothetical protein D9611_007065 [Tulosesus angulatus]